MSKVQKSYNKKQYYNKNNQKRITVDVNLKGFLCSCNNREKDCVRESYNLLNKYADILWPPKPVASSEEQGGNVEDDFQRELKELRSERNTKRFQVVDSGAKNFLFIRTTLEDPVKLAKTILEEISEKKTQETKFLLRLVPVETTCKAYVNDITKAFEPLCEKYFSAESKSFSIVFNHRNNSSVSRDEVIKSIADIVTAQGSSKNLEHKVDLKNAEVSIVIEVIRGFAFLSVVPNFFKLKKYNLLAFVTEQDTGSTSNITEGNSDQNVTPPEDCEDNLETNVEYENKDEN